MRKHFTHRCCQGGKGGESKPKDGGKKGGGGGKGGKEGGKKGK